MLLGPAHRRPRARARAAPIHFAVRALERGRRPSTLPMPLSGRKCQPHQAAPPYRPLAARGSQGDHGSNCDMARTRRRLGSRPSRHGAVDGGGPGQPDGAGQGGPGLCARWADDLAARRSRRARGSASRPQPAGPAARRSRDRPAAPPGRRGALRPRLGSGAGRRRAASKPIHRAVGAATRRASAAVQDAGDLRRSQSIRGASTLRAAARELRARPGRHRLCRQPAGQRARRLSRDEAQHRPPRGSHGRGRLPEPHPRHFSRAKAAPGWAVAWGLGGLAPGAAARLRLDLLPVRARRPARRCAAGRRVDRAGRPYGSPNPTHRPARSARRGADLRPSSRGRARCRTPGRRPAADRH